MSALTGGALGGAAALALMVVGGGLLWGLIVGLDTLADLALGAPPEPEPDQEPWINQEVHR